MSSITLEEAQSRLGEIIAQLSPGEGLVITAAGAPVAQLFPFAKQKPEPRFGSCKGALVILADDDDHLEDFKEYMS